MTEVVLEDLYEDEEKSDPFEFAAHCAVLWSAGLEPLEDHDVDMKWPENPPVVSWEAYEGETRQDIARVVAEVTGYECDNIIPGDHPIVVVPAINGLAAAAFEDFEFYPTSVDAKLYPILKYLWEHGVNTWCSCQGGEASHNSSGMGYLTFYGESNYRVAHRLVERHFKKLPEFHALSDDNKGVFGVSWYWKGEIPSLEELLAL